MHLECKDGESLAGALISSHRAISSEDQNLKEIILRGYPYFLVSSTLLMTLFFFFLPHKQPKIMQEKIQEWSRSMDEP